MNVNTFPSLIGDKVIVEIPHGLPALMMDVAREVLRHVSADETESCSSVADHLDCLLRGERGGKDDLMDMLTNLTKTDVERHIDGLIASGYTVEQLDKLTSIIQQAWRRYRNKRFSPDDTPDHAVSAHNEILRVYGATIKTAIRAAVRIQRAWRKHRGESSSQSKGRVSYKWYVAGRTTVWGEEERFDYESFECDPDDLERVNVVNKGHNDYVPPISDFIDDSDSLGNPNATDWLLRRMSTEDEDLRSS